MAKVPSIKFRAEDLLQDGAMTPEKVADALNRVVQTQRESLNHGITHAENLRSQVVTLRVVTAATVADTFPLQPVRLADFMPQKPIGVRVLSRSVPNTPSTTFNTASDVDWTPTGNGQVTIRYISGLSASTEYLLTLLIEG